MAEHWAHCHTVFCQQTKRLPKYLINSNPIASNCSQRNRKHQTRTTAHMSMFRLCTVQLRSNDKSLYTKYKRIKLADALKCFYWSALIWFIFLIEFPLQLIPICMPIIRTTLDSYCARTTCARHQRREYLHETPHNHSPKPNKRKKNVLLLYSNYGSVRWRSVRVCVWLRSAEYRVYFPLLTKYIPRSKSSLLHASAWSLTNGKLSWQITLSAALQRQARTPLTLIENDWHHKCKSTIYAIRSHTHTVLRWTERCIDVYETDGWTPIRNESV